MKRIRKILFINFGGLGDEILFLPSILSVKKEFGDAKISLALEPRSKGITQLTDVIDETLYANVKGKNKYFELIKLLFTIWTKRFDIVVASGANKLISLFLFCTFIPQKYGYYTGKLSEILLTKAVKLNKEQYAVNMYHDLVKYITNYKTDLPELRTNKREIIPNSVLIHPGVSQLSIKKGMIKTVPAIVWSEVVQKLCDAGKHVMLAGGPDDKEIMETILNKVSSDKLESFYGKTKNLKDLAELISSAEMFLCSDSAPLHIAVALGVRTFVIFGSTDDKKLIPDNNRVFPIKAKTSCPLQPCLWERRQTTCEKLECLNISSDDIVKVLLNS